MKTPELSVIIPVYNEEAGLRVLFDRLYPALDALELSYEVIFVNDGSRDRYAALLAGFEASRGEKIITLDADLENPPEEIGKVVEQMRAGHDYVGTIRAQRRRSVWRHQASRLVNRMNAYGETNIFIPALGYTFAQNPAEIEVAHDKRFAGDSKYSFYALIRLAFDLVTGFSVAPLQWLSFAGLLLSAGSAALFVLLVVRRFILGAEVEGVFTLFAINFFLIGVVIFALGLLGEYIGRIYQQVRAWPRQFAHTRLEKAEKAEDEVKQVEG